MVNLRIRPSSVVPLVVAVVLLLFQIFSPAPPIMFVLIIITGMLGVSYAWVRITGSHVSILRHRRYGWAQVGDLVEERFSMRNSSFLPLLWVEVRDFSDLPGYSASRAVGLGAMDSMQWITSGVCERRGVYNLGPLEVSLGDPFGLFECTLRQDHRDTFVVYPAIVALPRLLDPRGFARGSGGTDVRSLELTTNASSVRHYVPGDALNRIHWPSTARRSAGGQEEIFVKEFDLEPSGDVWIILDMEEKVQLGEGDESTEECAVILAASLASQMLHADHGVGLVSHGKEPIVIPPQKGRRQLWELLRTLAGVHAVGQVSLDSVLRPMEPVIARGMSAAVITPSLDPEWIDALGALIHRGLYPTALLLDARAFGGDGDTQGIVRTLADLGVSGHVLGQGFRFEQLTRQRQKPPARGGPGARRLAAVGPGEKERAEWVSVGRDRG